MNMRDAAPAVTDEAIIELFFARSEQAIAALCQRYGGRMRAVSMNILHNEQDAEECVNDACLGVWNTVPPTRPDPLCTYACRITRNVSLRRYEYNRAAKRDGVQVELDALTELLSDGGGLAQETDSQEITCALEEFLEGLDELNRYLFVRRYWFFDPVEELAKRLRMTRSALYLRLDCMKKRLRKRLMERGIWV